MPRGSSEQGTDIGYTMKWMLSLLKNVASSPPSLLRGCPSPFHPLKESLEASKTELSAHQSPAWGGGGGGAIRTRVLSAEAIMWPDHTKGGSVPHCTEGEGYLVMDIRLSAEGCRQRSLLMPVGCSAERKHITFD